MSLFKTRIFWSTLTEDEYYDQNSLIVSKLNSDNDYIVSGSQSGVLRIFEPSCDSNGSGDINGYVATDLLVEKIFNHSILQVGAGRFVSGSHDVHLAVLHPKLLSVFNFKIKEGVTEHGTQHFLEKVYDHNLQKSAASFTIGPFGGTQNRDFICVQSLDGVLMFFEQENFNFSCLLLDFLLPSPIAYIKKTDSFITGNGNWHIHSYKYNSLSGTEQKSKDNNNSQSRTISDWNYNIGETIIDISVEEDVTSKQSSIMILGERNIFCLNERGRLKFMKRLEYSPVSFMTYMLGENIYFSISSENSLLIYQNTTLKWSAKLNFPPICMKRGFFEHVKGALVFLSEEGRLDCCYLGTEPSPFVSPILATTEMDFDKIEEELETVNSVLKNSYGNDMKLTSQTAERGISMKIQISPDLSPCTFENSIKSNDDLHMCIISIDIIPQMMFEEVQVTVAVLPPMEVHPKTQFHSSISDKCSFTCYAYLHDESEVPSLNVDVMATVISNLGIPMSITKSSFLPLKLVAKIDEPQKDSEHEITLHINQTLVPIARLFPEFIEDISLLQSASTLAFKFTADTGSTVTILQAESSGYRVQSNSLASLSVIIEQMIFRLKKHYSNTNAFKVLYDSALPSNELVLYVDGHFKSRQRVIQLEEDLCQLCSQYRLIQKRLIAKFRMKIPSPLTNFEILLEDTHSNIIEVTEKLKSANSELSRARTNLSCGLNLLVNLMKVMEIDEKLRESLVSVFCPSIQDLECQNWEDVFDSSLCYLLRTCLAKSEKDTMRMAQTKSDKVKDVSKLIKHIVQVLERVFEADNTFEIDATAGDNNREKDEQNQEVLTIEKPLGNQFSEASTRLLSARRSLLRRKHKD